MASLNNEVPPHVNSVIRHTLKLNTAQRCDDKHVKINGTARFTKNKQILQTATA